METIQPGITVAMASYNHSQYVLHALDSVLKEDYLNKDLLIIDDGSTDNSKEIIQNWVDRNNDKMEITFISRPNKGLTATLNEMLDIIKGDYIAFLASDDAYCDNALTRMMNCMIQTNKKLVVADSKVIDENGIQIAGSWMKEIMKRDVNLYKTEKGIMREMLIRPAISGSVLLLKKDIFNIIGKYPEDFIAEDWYFYQRCAANRFVVYLDEVVSEYRRHGLNTSIDPNKKKLLVKNIIKGFWRNWILFPGINMKLLALKQWMRWNYIYLRTYIIK